MEDHALLAGRRHRVEQPRVEQLAEIPLDRVAARHAVEQRDRDGAADATRDLAGARRAVGYHLVSRPTDELDAGKVASATIESVAENLTDSLVAPALFFLVGGLAGAAVYRAVNTADAMIGYRDGALEYFGKLAARLDDILNLIPARLAAFQRLAERKGGLACLHWAMGSKPVEHIPAFTALFGGCHGGPDRKYQFLETQLRPAMDEHPITRGIAPITVHDEFYYALKWTDLKPGPRPLMEAIIEEAPQTVAWAWDRPDGGRSFGFSGLHFHDHWKRAEYRRLVAQGVMWSAGVPVPEKGLNVDLAEADYRPPAKR